MSTEPATSTDPTMSRTIDVPWTEALASTRLALGDEGFGVLTEIDLAETLRAKLGVETPRRVVLGACRPQLAHQALAIDPRVAVLLPCNVVVTEVDDTRSRVDVFDPAAMTAFVEADELTPVVTDARERLGRMLTSLIPSR